MDLKLIIQTFIAVFFAEFGDKTQIAAFSLSATNKGVMEVIVGASVAFILVTIIGVLAGKLAGQFISENVLKIASGVIFILLGVITLIRS